jgi:arylsulfatase A-like enzyme
VQEVDVYPTVARLLGLPVHPGVQGRDLSTTVLGGPETGCEYVTCELDLLPNPQYAPSQTIRTRDWKLELFPGARTGMLFNLRDDPGERHNLFLDPGHAGTRDALTFELLHHLYETKDPLPVRLRGA